MAEEVEVNGEVTEANWNDIKGPTAVKQEAEKVASPDDELTRIKAELASRDAEQKALRETADAEHRARLAAEQRAAKHEQDVTRLRTEAATAQVATVESTLVALQHEQTNAKAALRAAMEAADYEKAAEAQAVLSTVSARIVGQEMLKNDPRLRAPDPVSAASYTQPTRTNDAVENFLSGFSPSSQAWLRQHRDAIQPDANGVKLSPQVMAAHYQAQANSLTVDTPEYFHFIEQQLAPEPPIDGEIEIDPQTPAATAAAPLRRAAPVSAPVSRETQPRNTQATDPKRIRLTAEQAEAAAISGMSPLDYYNNLQALKAEGKIGRTAH